jgi:hypothetical protein
MTPSADRLAVDLALRSMLVITHDEPIRGLWHNLAYEVDGDRLTVAVAIMESDTGRGRARPRGKAPRISITLCPKKIQQWRNQQRPQSPTTAAAAALAPPSASAPASVSSASRAASPPSIVPPCDPTIERLLGLRVPMGTRMFRFEIPEI